MKYPQKSHPGRAGAPRKHETKRRYNVTLSEQTARDLQMIGGGNRSTAIEEVTAYYLAHAFGLTEPTQFAADTRHAPDGGGASDNQGQG